MPGINSIVLALIAVPGGTAVLDFMLLFAAVFGCATSFWFL